jgi:hypothetical protein
LDPPIIEKTIFSSRQRFPKPVRPYKMLSFFGSNIVTTEFDEWKRHRKIAAPSFSEVATFDSWTFSNRLSTRVLRKTTSSPLRSP